MHITLKCNDSGYDEKIWCTISHKFLVIPAMWKNVTMIKIGKGANCLMICDIFSPIAPSVMHIVANDDIHKIMTTELMVICFFDERIEENLVNFAMGMLIMSVKPTHCEIHSVENSPP